jgi:putative PIN family toxin of toxin-antitoxin system
MTPSKPTAVFDTGVVLQATISAKGPAAKALTLFDEDELTLFVSEELLEEMRIVLTRPAIRQKNARYTDEDLEDLLDRLRHEGTLISPLPAHFQYERDPEDEHVINLAIEAKAEFLVSRDKDLLGLMADPVFTASYPSITVLDPAAFLKRIGATSS